MFDYVMGVGKTPQITTDITLNPYSVPYDDLVPLIFPKIVLGGSSSQNGTWLNVINPNFDYIGSDPLTLLSTSDLSGSSLTLDFGRKLYIRGLNLYFALYNNAGESVQVILQFSEDGINWVNKETFNRSGAVGRTYFDRNYSGLHIRYIKFVCSGGWASFIMCRIMAMLDSVQTFYS